MAVIEYTCDKCKRTKQIIRNPTGLETLKSCNITQNCTGKLQQTRVLENFIRGADPETVQDLADQQFRPLIYNYEQPVPRKIWRISHNLGNIPLSWLYNSEMELFDEHLYTIKHIDENTTQFTFNEKVAGIAHLVVSNSAPPVVPNFSTTTTTSVNSIVQLSYGSKLVIATLDDSVNINIELTFVDSSGNETTHLYNVSNVNDDVTWGDFSQAIIKGKTYTVRSFDVIFNQTINNSYFRFNNTSANNIFILLSGNPRSSYDKILNQIIDASVVTSTTNRFDFVVTNNEFVASTNILQDVYPYIRKN